MKKKTVILGITGSIAAYKIPQMARDLRKEGFDVLAVMTRSALKFVTPWTLEALTGNPVFHRMFYLKSDSVYPHIEISKKADVIAVAPATANFIAKAGHGIADDLLSAVFLSCVCPKIIAPAMNERMYLSEQTQDNIRQLREKGVRIVPAERGALACGDEGAGRMAAPGKIISAIKDTLSAHARKKK
jgi:phosphopantothenoylcysteine decarboxylase / phosphopantothenate---cysteine ligase